MCYSPLTKILSNQFKEVVGVGFKKKWGTNILTLFKHLQTHIKLHTKIINETSWHLNSLSNLFIIMRVEIRLCP